jgi:integrase
MSKHGKYQSPSTQQKYNQRFQQISEHPIAQIPLPDIKKSDVYDYVDKRLEKDKVSNSTVNMEIKLMKGMLNFARKRDIIKDHQIDDVELRKEPKPYKVYIDEEELQKLIGSLPKRVALIVEFAIYTGLRKENILDLKIDQIDFKNRLVRVIAKGERDDAFPLSEAAIEVLREAIGDRKEGYVFLNHAGQRYFRTLSTFERRVRKLKLKVSNGNKFRFHDLRHVFGTWLRLKGVPQNHISELMGHASPKTSERYTVIGASDVAHHVEKISRIKSIDKNVEEKKTRKQRKKK